MQQRAKEALEERSAEMSRMEKAEIASHGPSGQPSEEQLVTSTTEDDDARFRHELDAQLDKVSKFYDRIERETTEQARAVRKQFDELGYELPAKSLPPAAHENPLVNAIVEDPALHENYQESVSDVSMEDKNTLQRSHTVSGGAHTPFAHVNAQDDSHRPPTRSHTIGDSEALERLRERQHERRRASEAAVALTRMDSYRLRLANNYNMPLLRRTGTNKSDLPDVQEFNQQLNFRFRCGELYVRLHDLASFIQYNKTAFDKITKKWDKITGSNLRQTYYEGVVEQLPMFRKDRIFELDTAMSLIQDMYAAIFTQGDIQKAIDELKWRVRDQIEIERNTIWQDMVAMERKAHDAHAVEPEPGYYVPYTNKFFVSRRNIRRAGLFLLSLAMYIILMCIDTLGNTVGSKCLALLIFSAMLWAFEVCRYRKANAF